MKLLMITRALTSLWSECGKRSMLEVVVFVSEVESQKIERVLLAVSGVGLDHVHSLMSRLFALQKSKMSKCANVSLYVATSLSW